LPLCRWRLKAQRPLPSVYPKEIKTLGDHIRKRRLDLGLLQRDVAAQIGVNKDTIYNWETNRNEPEVRLIPHMINFLGYAPYDPNWSFGQRLRAVRSALGLSQEQLAKMAGLDEGTVSEWEREEHKPTKKT
jgi:transcriptional regulator with XRE-family HTH domain